MKILGHEVTISEPDENDVITGKVEGLEDIYAQAMTRDQLFDRLTNAAMAALKGGQTIDKTCRVNSYLVELEIAAQNAQGGEWSYEMTEDEYGYDSGWLHSDNDPSPEATIGEIFGCNQNSEANSKYICLASPQNILKLIKKHNEIEAENAILLADAKKNELPDGKKVK